MIEIGKCRQKQRTVLVAIALAVASAMAAADGPVTLEDTKRAQDPFEFSRMLDYRQFEMLDFKDADLENVAV